MARHNPVSTTITINTSGYAQSVAPGELEGVPPKPPGSIQGVCAEMDRLLRAQDEEFVNLQLIHRLLSDYINGNAPCKAEEGFPPRASVGLADAVEAAADQCRSRQMLVSCILQLLQG